MKKNRIHIERLKIRLPHRLAPDARNIATGIGREIAQQIAAVGKGKTGAIRIDDLSIDPIRTTRAADIPNRVAGKVVHEVGKHLKERGKR